MLNMGKFSLEARLFMQNVGFVYEKKNPFYYRYRSFASSLP